MRESDGNVRFLKPRVPDWVRTEAVNRRLPHRPSTADRPALSMVLAPVVGFAMIVLGLMVAVT